MGDEDSRNQGNPHHHDNQSKTPGTTQLPSDTAKVTSRNHGNKAEVTPGSGRNHGNKGASERPATGPSRGWQHDITYTDVVVIGNGPSGICLSYLLSGHWPYYTGEPHPNEYLNLRLQDSGTDKSLIEMDLEYLSSGLEGRSSNPVALLFDSVTHPDADMGVEKASLLSWQHRPEKAIPHVVLGRKAEGGAWQMMEAEMQTLSLGTWMELPNMSFQKWLKDYRSMMQEVDPHYYLPPIADRASMDEVCAYYMDYVRTHDLGQYFRNYSTVTSVERVLDVTHSIDCESGEQQPCSSDHRGKVKWEVRGQTVTTSETGDSKTEEFCYRAPSVVIATGSYDTPNKLGVSGENQPYVLHSLGELEKVIKAGLVTPDSDPVMVVGAGLSAADTILLARGYQLPVVHVFRRDTKDKRIVLRQLPSALYPEYHHVLDMMQGSGDDEHYDPRPTSQVHECLEDGKVVIHNNRTGVDTLVKVSYLVVLIGSRPNLSFLPHDGKNLGITPGRHIDSKNNPLDVDAFTYQSIYEVGLYGMGPLVGDNFVRFLRGGALGISSHLLRKKEGLL